MSIRYCKTTDTTYMTCQGQLQAVLIPQNTLRKVPDLNCAIHGSCSEPLIGGVKRNRPDPS